MALNRYKTAGDILNAAALELGLGTTADPYSDANFAQLVRHLEKAGLALATGEFTWRQLVSEWTFTTGVGEPTPGAGFYDLPADWVAIIPRTAWDRASDRPLYGPLSPAGWQARKANVAAGIFPEFRLGPNQLLIFPQPPAAGIEVALEYRSRAWVRLAADTLGNGQTLGTAGSDKPVAAGDWVLFEPEMMIALVKALWKREKGEDASAAEADFARALARAQAANTTRPTLDLAGQSGGPRFISVDNIPDILNL